MTVESKSEAFFLFETWRSDLLARARGIAFALCRRHGRTNSREVREAMRQLGLLDPDVDERWLGSVFVDRVFVWTGDFLEVESASVRTRNGGGGGRDVRVWTIRPEYAARSLPADALSRQPGDEALAASGKARLREPAKAQIAKAVAAMRIAYTRGVSMDDDVIAVMRWLAKKSA